MFLIAAFLCLFPPSISAEVAPLASRCPGNICGGAMVIGGQTVNYAYTQHIRPDGLLKVRLNGGVYNQDSLISHIIHGLPVFSGWDKYANPTNGAVFLPEEEINPARTAYERYDTDGCAGCIVDQVLSVSFSGLAEGDYTFDISIFQNGQGGSENGLVFYVDAGAPSNTDESEAWGVIPDMDFPCADSVDNDLNFFADCRDAAVCVGQVGDVGSGARCEDPETSCADGFDNDGDGFTDCADPSCDGLIGRLAPSVALCRFGNEGSLATCTDGFDNDGDGFTDCVDPDCWKQDAFGCPSTETSCSDGIDNDKDMSFDIGGAWDDNPLTGVDCQDYDCAGDPNCPAREHLDKDGNEVENQCFDGLDNDLDGLFDCADPDCLGMDNGVFVCYEKEFDIIGRYQMCTNVFDDDGDGDVDCADSDCGRQFGNCGPCPSREDVTYDSCADGRDNDHDGPVDCADPDCTSGGPGPDASLGYLAHAARCAESESGNDMCSDGFDNDGDGLVDCADPGCAGFAQCAGTEAPAMCSDGFDNDGDGLMDCVDPACWGFGTCAPGNVAAASCLVVPRMGPYKAFAAVSPTVTAAAREAAHVDSTDIIRLVGTGNYTSITIVIGDNTTPDDYYLFSQPKTSPTPCTLAGTNSAKLDFIAVPGRVVQIYNRAGETLNGFDLTFTCPTTSEPLSLRDYPISVSVLKSGGVPEYGDRMFGHTLYENLPPFVSKIEAEGENLVGAIDVKWGEGRRFRAIATDQDPGGALWTSGICACTFTIGGVDHSTPDSDCVSGPVRFYDDEVIQVSAYAEDGADNTGPAFVRDITVNVGPELVDPLVAYPADGVVGSAPFFRTHKHILALGRTTFMTAASDSFDPTCEVLIRNRLGNIIGGVNSASFLGLTVGNTVSCENLNLDLTTDLTVGWPIPDGEYFVTIRATDSDGDSVESNRQVIYVCNSVPAPPGDESNVCSWADFDRDGAAEGLYTSLYWGSYQACDNCVNLFNPLQKDENANGVGEMCEPGACGIPGSPTGRCEVDRSVVCGYDSDAAGFCPGDAMCCPDAGAPQSCKCPWGLCLYGGQVCFDDPECKFCDDDPTVGCITDDDCALAGVGGVCDGGGGFGVCAGDGATVCKRDSDCAGAIPSVAGPCMGANICDNLMFPWLETTYGNVFSGRRIFSSEKPPATKFNATYCITAKSSVLNFTSELCDPVETHSDVDYTRPKPDNAYATVLGRIDVKGLLAGRYGEVVTVTAAELDAMLPAVLDGKVFAVIGGGDVRIEAHEFSNAALDKKGKGTVLIVGGDLYIDGDSSYAAGTVTRLSYLASVGWMVLPAADGSKGNIYIKESVRHLVGAFFAGGDDGIYTVAPPMLASEVPLTIYGLAIARKFHFGRTLRNVNMGSERFIYDGRAVVNPPPGFEDIKKSLPVITDMP